MSNTEVWILDLARKTQRRLTFGPGMDGLPFWTPDGRRIIFMSARVGVLNWYSQAADGTGAVERLTTSANAQWPTSITPDATHLFGYEIGRVIVADAATAGGAGSRAARDPNGWSGPCSTDAWPSSRRTAAFWRTSPDESGETDLRPAVPAGRQRPLADLDDRAARAPRGRGTAASCSTSMHRMTLIRVPVQTSGSTFSVGNPAKVFDATVRRAKSLAPLRRVAPTASDS